MHQHGESDGQCHWASEDKLNKILIVRSGRRPYDWMKSKKMTVHTACILHSFALLMNTKGRY